MEVLLLFFVQLIEMVNYNVPLVSETFFLFGVLFFYYMVLAFLACIVYFMFIWLVTSHCYCGSFFSKSEIQIHTSVTVEIIASTE